MRRLGLVIVLGLGLLPAARARAADEGFPGFVRSDDRVEVKAKLAAPIRRVAVREGEFVRAGQVLVELVNDVQRAQVESARAELARARSAVVEAEAALRRAEAAVAEVDVRLASARREYERNLQVPDLMPARELDLSRDAVHLAEAELRTRREEVARAEAELARRRDEVARAEAELAVARAQLEDTFLVAPFDGVVSRIYLRPGATPRPADTTVLDFLALDRLYVEVALPLARLRTVRPGMPVTVIVEPEHAALAVRPPARVEHVYPELDPRTRTVRVKIHVDHLDFRVRPGMAATVRLEPPAPGRVAR